MTKRLTLFLLLTGSLAGCSRADPEAPPETNVAIERRVLPAPVSPSPAARPSPAAEPSVDVNAADVEPPRSEEVGADEQMLDDASATGMTARVERTREEATESSPADLEEK